MIDDGGVLVVQFLDDLDCPPGTADIPCPTCGGDELCDGMTRFVCLDCLGDGTVRVLARDVE
jgi:hypothetical protein